MKSQADLVSGVGIYVTSGVAARWFGVTRRTVVRWIKRGTVPGVRLCGACLYGCARCRYYAYRQPLMALLQAAREG